MTRKEIVRTSRFIALVLRHRPQAAGIELDEHGWADVRELIDGVNACGRHRLDMATLEEIVRTDEKGRYSFDETHSHIRANQGHSIPVDVGLTEATPPDVLFHGTAERFCTSIEREGLLPMSRLHVHLSQDVPTAVKVGSRHGRPVVWRVDARRMYEDGRRFYLSQNGVWLTERVPPEYLSRVDSADATEDLGE